MKRTWHSPGRRDHRSKGVEPLSRHAALKVTPLSTIVQVAVVASPRFEPAIERPTNAAVGRAWAHLAFTRIDIAPTIL